MSNDLSAQVSTDIPITPYMQAALGEYLATGRTRRADVILTAMREAERLLAMRYGPTYRLGGKNPP